jgi:hypothetical protein
MVVVMMMVMVDGDDDDDDDDGDVAGVGDGVRYDCTVMIALMLHC